MVLLVISALESSSLYIRIKAIVHIIIAASVEEIIIPLKILAFMLVFFMVITPNCILCSKYPNIVMGFYKAT